MNDRTPKVTAVIVTYESRETIGPALDALREAHDAGLADAVVVDNASTDGTADHVAQQHPWVTLVRSDENLGYGRGCNKGFEHVATEYALVMNPDAVVDHAALSTLVHFMDDHAEAGLCGPAVQEESGALQPAGALPSPWKVMLRPLLPRLSSRGMRHVIPGEAPQRTNWICGSIMLIRRRMLDDIGWFDPRFFLYFEESDLCRRAHDARWEIWTVGTSICRHVNAASARGTRAEMMWGTISQHYFRSRYYYLVKHHGWALAVTSEAIELVTMLMRAIVDRLRGRSYAHLSPRLRAPKFSMPSAAHDLNVQTQPCSGIANAR